VTYVRNQGAAQPTPDELAYSPFISESTSATSGMMGTYEVFGPPTSYPAFPTASPPPSLPPSLMGSYAYEAPPGYKLVPLSGEGSSRGMTRGQKILAALVVIGIVAAIVYMVRKSKGKGAKEPVTPSQAIKKLPTSRLAQNLYQRLARNGKGTRGVMTALSQLSEE
jgi:hypothetical protein